MVFILLWMMAGYALVVTNPVFVLVGGVATIAGMAGRSRATKVFGGLAFTLSSGSLLGYVGVLASASEARRPGLPMWPLAPIWALSLVWLLWLHRLDEPSKALRMARVAVDLCALVLVLASFVVMGLAF
ncbi:MAG: hypothetical protein R3B72_38380 [Polyangiaceae bacterium]